MGDGESDREGVFDSASPEEPIANRTPSLRATVFLLAGAETREVGSLIPDRIEVRTFTDRSSFRRELGGDVAVAMLSVPAGGADPATVRRTICESPHARIGLVATDGAQLLDCETPHDEAVVLPDEREEIPAVVKRLYVRAYYAATVQRYYKVCLSIKNREISRRANGQDRLSELQETRNLLESYLQRFRRFLTSADFEAMSSREDRLRSLARAAKNDPDPGALDLPDACPDCGLDWTDWHGRRLRNGYERIGAGTWRCTGCGGVIADNDPDTYQVG